MIVAKPLDSDLESKIRPKYGQESARETQSKGRIYKRDDASCKEVTDECPFSTRGVSTSTARSCAAPHTFVTREKTRQLEPTHNTHRRLRLPVVPQRRHLGSPARIVRCVHFLTGEVKSTDEMIQTWKEVTNRSPFCTRRESQHCSKLCDPSHFPYSRNVQTTRQPPQDAQRRFRLPLVSSRYPTVTHVPTPAPSPYPAVVRFTDRVEFSAPCFQCFGSSLSTCS